MRSLVRCAALGIAMALVAAGCGGDSSTTSTAVSPGDLGRPRLDHRDDPAAELLRRVRPRLPGRLRAAVSEHQDRVLLDGLQRRGDREDPGGLRRGRREQLRRRGNARDGPEGHLRAAGHRSVWRTGTTCSRRCRRCPACSPTARSTWCRWTRAPSGIVYNADVVTTPPDSWSDLFDPQWAGRAGMEDIAVTAFMIGALTNGIPDPINMDRIADRSGEAVPHRPQVAVPHVLEGRRRGEVAVQVRRDRHQLGLSRHREGAPEGGRQREVRGGERGSVPVGLRIRASPPTSRRRTSTRRTRCSTTTRAPRPSSTRPSTGTTRWPTPRCWTSPRPSSSKRPRSMRRSTWRTPSLRARRRTATRGSRPGPR